MDKRIIIFDLDGTLTDSGEGIINCAALALEHFGIPVPDRQTMGVFVGPPLRDTFAQFGVPQDKLEEAITVFRSRYVPIGKYENTPYPGIHKLLADLCNAGYTLCVATSKPETTALDILDKFELSQYFKQICGAQKDATRDEKSQVIAYLLSQIGDDLPAIMVGDTAFDVIGAAKHGIPAIGVSWGYGNVADMQEAGAKAIAHTMDELYSLLTN